MTPAPARPDQHRRLVIRQDDNWRPALLRLGLLAGGFTLLFHTDIFDLVRVWLNSTPYGHCIFIPPILFWLVWQRRDGLARMEPQGWWPGVAWLAAGALLWLLGWASDIALFRHAALVLMGQGLVLATLGPAIGRALAFPLFYALFMIPVGTEAEPVMQLLTARMAIGMLWLAGVPAEISGVFITTPNGYFRVAEACSGTGFLIAMAAFCALAAHLCFKRARRRALFVAGALLACFIANGVRAFGIILIAYHSSVDAAVVVDHIVYGWLFFALVIILVMLVARRWFDRSPLDPWFEPERLQGVTEGGGGDWRALTGAALLVMAAPLLWSLAGHAMALPLPAQTQAPAVPGWSRIEAAGPSPWAPHFDGADRIVLAHYRDAAGRRVDLALILFADQRDGKELVGFGQGAAGPDDASDWRWSAPAPAPAPARGEWLAGLEARQRLVWTWYRLDGTLTGQASRVKLATLRARLLGGDRRAMAILLSAPVPDSPDGRAVAQGALRDFLVALPPIEQVADRSLGIR